MHTLTKVQSRHEHAEDLSGPLTGVSTGAVWDPAARVLGGHLDFEESAVGAHAQLVAHPLARSKLVPAGGARQAGRADHHSSIEDDAVFLLGE